MQVENYRKYMTQELTAVEGWVGAQLHESLEAVARFQMENGIVGSAAEIGVYRGKFAIGLSWLLRNDEEFCAIDIFDDQWMNIDKSGTGAALGAFKANWDKFANPNVRLVVEQNDSMSLNRWSTDRIFSQVKPVRLFSIDGGHTAEHVVTDMKLAIQYAARGSVLFVDDYLNPYWPGVHEGVAKYMFFETPSFRPFCFHQNKLFMSSITYAQAYMEWMKAKCSRPGQTKVTKMFGFDVLVI